MRPSILAIALATVIAGAHAQSVVNQPTQDGAITISNDADLTGGRVRTQAPIIIVSGSKSTTTSWGAQGTGSLTIRSPVSGLAAATSQLNPSGAAVNLNAAAATQPPTIIRTGSTSRWIPQTQSCPAYYSGAITWEAEEVQTVVSTWRATGTTRNYQNACVAIVETQWVAQSQECPAYYSGSNTWQAEQRRSGGGPWSYTGATRNASNSCTAIVETQWVAQSQGCPAYYSGTNTWQAEQRRSGGGPWSYTGATRNASNSCTAIVETQWVGVAGGCPAGYSGWHNWEAEQRRSGGGAWAATGAVRNDQNTCTAPPPPTPTPTPTPPPPAVCAVTSSGFRTAAGAGSTVAPPRTCTGNDAGRLALVQSNIRSVNQQCQDQSQYVCNGSTWTLLSYRTERRCDAGTNVGPPQYQNWDVAIEVAGLAQEQAGPSGQAAFAAVPGANAIATYGCNRF
ncbi:hypothetical protein [Xanthomonas arboricola]|uniref:hypothetical protein n=1 Tax=Xanthomonas arboricola TaxID=56448 RepID=UPI000AB0E256|nr:hypothetical protein [Xanthomonas arboricola]